MAGVALHVIQAYHHPSVSSITLPQSRSRRPLSYNNIHHRLCMTSGKEKQGSLSSTTTINSNNTCPFSRTFPRFRIDLSNDRNEKKNASMMMMKKINVFGGGLDKMRVENAYKNKPGLQESLSAMSEIPVGSSSISEFLSPIKATALFWKYVADLEQQQTQQSDDNPQELVLALPGVRSIVARRLIEILEWYNANNAEFSSTTTPFANGKVTATLDDGISSTLPVITLTCARASGSSAIASTGALKSKATAIGIQKTDEDDDDDDDDNSVAIENRTKAWVKRVLVNLGVCPFTKSTTKSGQGLGDLGVPVARIAYSHSTANKTELAKLLADAWFEIYEMLEAGPSGKGGVSSILLSAPEFDDDFALWAGPVFSMLEACVSAANAESQVGVVCFHPMYATPDGKSWGGFGQMHSVPRLRGWLDEQDGALSSELTDDEVAAGGAWQRRTPHAVINVLRAEQLAIAEGQRQTGSLYTENIRKLVGKVVGIGSSKLAEDLERERSML
uniref:Uncharacterized protein n=1 Tax=Leptocylindrus danicus TaxID=163516 RepID=A0A7S2PP62_9STRA